MAYSWSFELFLCYKKYGEEGSQDKGWGQELIPVVSLHERKIAWNVKVSGLMYHIYYKEEIKGAAIKLDEFERLRQSFVECGGRYEKANNKIKMESNQV